jgi:hypothetical protein
MSPGTETSTYIAADTEAQAGAPTENWLLRVWVDPVRTKMSMRFWKLSAVALSCGVSL